MHSAALKQELDQRIEMLPDESVRLLIQFIDSLNPKTGIPAKPGGRRAVKRQLGRFAGNLHYMADDFDETPECFKDYMCEGRA